jgi:2'-5' RNA ligase
MRLFTAINIPDTLRTELSDLQDPDALVARWSDPDQFHITLRFIGDASKAQAVQYEKALADVHAGPVRCVPRQPSGLDVLPSRRSPRVLMLGLERTDSILELYETVSDALEAEGLDPEDRKFRPHVTIGRLDDVKPNAVHDFLQAHEERSFQAFEAEQFVLYESTLRPDGAVHEPQSLYPLTP